MEKKETQHHAFWKRYIHLSTEDEVTSNQPKTKTKNFRQVSEFSKIGENRKSVHKNQLYLFLAWG